MEDYFAERAILWDSPDKVQMTNIFVQEMLKHVTPLKSWKALEVGAGTGLVGLQVLEMIRSIVFEDTSEAMLRVLEQKLSPDTSAEVLCGEVSDYVIPDIDWVFSCMAFHHIADTEGLLRHLHSVMKDGARLVIGDLLPEDGSFHRFDPIPHRGFDTDKLSALCRKVGFNVESVVNYNVLNRERVPGVMSVYGQFMLIARKEMNLLL